MSANIDQELYSRQIYVLGLDAMKRMANSSILISGLSGLGVEIAKNLILAGVHHVTIHDTNLTTASDLGSQFYLTEEDIGKNRAVQSLAKLSELNHHVSVDSSTDPLDEQLIVRYETVVIVGPHKQSFLNKISEFCHKNNICFICTETAGVFGYLFNDFGNCFTFNDYRGELPSRFMIEFITNEEKALVTIALDETHNLSDGEYVLFEEVSGMTELNGNSYRVTVKNMRSFYIDCDTRNFGKYEMVGSGGYGNQIYPQQKFAFSTLNDALTKPPPEAPGDLVETTRILSLSKVVDFDFIYDYPLLAAFFSIHAFIDANDRFPLLSDLEAVKEIFTSQKFLDQDSIDDILLKPLICNYGAEISPMDAIFGGIVAQEVLKSLSGKFTPIHQFLAINYLQALPENIESIQ